MVITPINHPGNVLMNDHPQGDFYLAFQHDVNEDGRFIDVPGQDNQTTLAEDNTKTVFTWQYFYSPNGSYKNAVWISNNRLPNVWIYVLINELGKKKARIWSENQIQVPNGEQELRNDYERPSQFEDQGLWVEHQNRVSSIEMAELLNEIAIRMDWIAGM
jgi:hypothetical protein